jgi:hypothetical protein
MKKGGVCGEVGDQHTSLPSTLGLSSLPTIFLRVVGRTNVKRKIAGSNHVSHDDDDFPFQSAISPDLHDDSPICNLF